MISSNSEESFRTESLIFFNRPLHRIGERRHNGDSRRCRARLRADARKLRWLRSPRAGAEASHESLIIGEDRAR
jgi:hypothetical protein